MVTLIQCSHGRYLAMYRSQHPSYDRLSGIGPGAGQRRTRPSPDANGLARAYPRQRIETRPPAVGSGDYVANPRFGIQRAHARAYGRLSGIGPGAGQRRTRPSPDANGLARAYPRQRIETRPPAVGSGDYVANPRFGIQRTHRRTVDYLALAQGPGGAEPATALMPTA